ncbi:hypothetical protein P7D52_02370 [Enterococcus dongliensis]|uniref:Uncharacterized protein n=1 Tax=Enterococcus dongliensis TaxID=2559925 RepID=A0AAW8TGM3_9ENTE|nr:hypothetical protein [Enterococcus dongliensis]MDT2595424.1 hypothetical protein [Enterococcus dongliensis]MDT2603362.1 hypothetical protein [Enterococcus dongliensis]MDT2633723.1 hypothetical protein [Enterococcus dongliensis]MDT2635903.1 hypothetical protein [Enterococcus dongliensis]MDT2641661.1 hypothetical protein [Enterococcus dongliensis]
MKTKDKGKAKWIIILFIALACFITALVTSQVIFNLIAIFLAILVYKFGNPILFKEYDEKRKIKYEDAIKVREAARIAVSSRKIFKK